jgi:dTMP kinase
MGRGRLITFEGGEGCGKSTQIALLAKRLEQAGHSCRTVREPGGTPLGEKIRHLVKLDPDGHGMAPETELLLMNASRAELVRRILLPELAAGRMLLCDRFYDSTIAYQAFGRELPLERVRSVIEAAVGTLRPDLTLWLRVPPGEARQRVQRRNDGGDRFEAEQAAFFARVEEGYQAIAAAEPHRVRAVDGTGSPELVHERIWSCVAPLLTP